MGLYQNAIVEYITPSGDYQVLFDGDSSKNSVKPDQIRKREQAVPVSNTAEETAKKEEKKEGKEEEEEVKVVKAANPTHLPAKDLALRNVKFIMLWLKENRAKAIECNIESMNDRKILLVMGQLAKYVRRMFEVPSNELEPFELKTVDVSKVRRKRREEKEKEKERMRVRKKIRHKTYKKKKFQYLIMFFIRRIWLLMGS